MWRRGSHLVQVASACRGAASALGTLAARPRRALSKLQICAPAGPRAISCSARRRGSPLPVALLDPTAPVHGTNPASNDTPTTGESALRPVFVLHSHCTEQTHRIAIGFEISSTWSWRIRVAGSAEEDDLRSRGREWRRLRATSTQNIELPTSWPCQVHCLDRTIDAPPAEDGMEAVAKRLTSRGER